MIISDLTYLETATEASNLEGGISYYDVGTSFFQHIQAVGAYAASGPSGSVVGGNVTDILTKTWGGLTIVF